MGFTTGPACDLAVCVPAEGHLLLQGIGDTVRAAVGLAGALGLNIWHGGPLDLRLDRSESEQ
jgi:hypothetical protein